MLGDKTQGELRPPLVASLKKLQLALTLQRGRSVPRAEQSEVLHKRILQRLEHNSKPFCSLRARKPKDMHSESSGQAAVVSDHRQHHASGGSCAKSIRRSSHRYYLATSLEKSLRGVCDFTLPGLLGRIQMHCQDLIYSAG